MEEDSKDLVKRRLKVRAYRKAHRLLRIGWRKEGHKREVSGAAIALIATSGGEREEEADTEEIRRERLEKNKEWRKRKEREKWESQGLQPPPGPEDIREKNRKLARKFEKKLHKELLCSNCRSPLLTSVWDCQAGHSTCGDCFDRENMGRDLAVSLGSLDVDTLKRTKSGSSLATVSSIETILSLRESLAEMAEGEGTDGSRSWDQYLVNEIDFFLDTLEVRKDAIDFYKDYNNAFKSIFYNPDIEGLSLDDDYGGKTKGGQEDNSYKDEKTERVRAYIQRLKDQGSLASLREALVDVIETEDDEIDPSWAKFRLEEIDFFLNTLNIRKDAISYYGDYHNEFQSIFQYLGQEDSQDTTGSNKEDDLLEERSGPDSEGKGRQRMTRCRVCSQFILHRNLAVENLAKLFFPRT